jgi:hypothetical protein
MGDYHVAEALWNWRLTGDNAAVPVPVPAAWGTFVFHPLDIGPLLST